MKKLMLFGLLFVSTSSAHAGVELFLSDNCLYEYSLTDIEPYPVAETLGVNLYSGKIFMRKQGCRLGYKSKILFASQHQLTQKPHKVLTAHANNLKSSRFVMSNGDELAYFDGDFFDFEYIFSCAITERQTHQRPTGGAREFVSVNSGLGRMESGSVDSLLTERSMIATDAVTNLGN